MATTPRRRPVTHPAAPERHYVTATIRREPYGNTFAVLLTAAAGRPPDTERRDITGRTLFWRVASAEAAERLHDKLDPVIVRVERGPPLDDPDPEEWLPGEEQYGDGAPEVAPIPRRRPVTAAHPAAPKPDTPEAAPDAPKPDAAPTDEPPPDATE